MEFEILIKFLGEREQKIKVNSHFVFVYNNFTQNCVKRRKVSF